MGLLTVPFCDVTDIALCTLVGNADDWHRDDPAEPGYDATITALAIETCGHCPRQAGCADRAFDEYAGVWGGLSAAELRNLTDPAGVDMYEADWVSVQREHDATLAASYEELTDEPYAMRAGGRRPWEPSDPSDVVLSVEHQGLRQTARELGVDRKTLRGWLSRTAA